MATKAPMGLKPVDAIICPAAPSHEICIAKFTGPTSSKQGSVYRKVHRLQALCFESCVVLAFPLLVPFVANPAARPDMNAAKITRRLVAAVEAFLGNTEATRKWPHVAAQAQQLHTAIDNEIVGTMMEPDRSKAQGNEQLFTKSSLRKLLRRLGYWKASTMVVAHVHDEALFRVKSYTDHTDSHFSLPGLEYTQALAIAYVAGSAGCRAQ